jgi:hypothetical protein
MNAHERSPTKNNILISYIPLHMHKIDLLFNFIRRTFPTSPNHKEENKLSDKVQKHLHIENNYSTNLSTYSNLSNLSTISTIPNFSKESNFQIKNLELEKQKQAFMKKQKKDRIYLNRRTDSVTFYQKFAHELKSFGKEFQENMLKIFNDFVNSGFTVTNFLPSELKNNN